MNTSFRVRSTKKIQDFLRSLPYGTRKIGLAAIAEYLLGDDRHGLRHDEPQKYISRKQAGYTTSAKQMRFFFATGILERTPDGGIKLNHYKRTGETANAWVSRETNRGYGIVLENEKKGAYYTRDNFGQTRQHEMAGRRKVSKVIADNLKGAIRHAKAEVGKWMRSNAK